MQNNLLHALQVGQAHVLLDPIRTRFHVGIKDRSSRFKRVTHATIELKFCSVECRLMRSRTEGFLVCLTKHKDQNTQKVQKNAFFNGTVENDLQIFLQSPLSLSLTDYE